VPDGVFRDLGLPLARIALLANLVVAWRLFRRTGLITRLLGRNGLRAASKVASLLRAAIAVRLIREGPGTFLQTPSS
jgi:small neutral amino acid transporter SnatA (MarC family)